MTISASACSPALLKKIDELSLKAHPFLRAEDEVYYLGDYTSGEKAAFSKTNKLILNYKKPMDRQGQTEWPFKQQAIREAAALFRFSIMHSAGLCTRANKATLIPVPPSSKKSSAEFDDRNMQLLKLCFPQGDVRELVVQKDSRLPFHAKNAERNPNALLGNYLLNQGELDRPIVEAWIFDDVLTQGTHFRAIHDFLIQNLPAVKVVGFFIARTILRKAALL